MKKVIAFIVAVVMVVSMLASMAFIIQAQRETTRQVQLVAVLPVTVSMASAGLKAYSEIVDTPTIYQANTLMTIATVIEMKNMAKHPLLSPVDGSRIDIKVSSKTANLAYANIAPAVIYSIIGANNWKTTDIASNTLKITNATTAIKYQPQDNSAIVKMKAVPNSTFTANGVSYNGRDINQGVATGSNWLNGTAQAYAPFCAGEFVYIPALNSKDFGNTQAPSAVQYTIIVSALTSPANKGHLKAEMLVTAVDAYTEIDSQDIYFSSVSAGKETVTAVASQVVINKAYTIIHLKGMTSTGQTVTEYLRSLGFEFTAAREAELAYRGVPGTLEIYQVYKYDENEANKRGEFICNFITEYSENPAIQTKGLWMTDKDLGKIIMNQNGAISGGTIDYNMNPQYIPQVNKYIVDRDYVLSQSKKYGTSANADSSEITHYENLGVGIKDEITKTITGIKFLPSSASVALTFVSGNPEDLAVAVAYDPYYKRGSGELDGAFIGLQMGATSLPDSNGSSMATAGGTAINPAAGILKIGKTAEDLVESEFGSGVIVFRVLTLAESQLLGTSEQAHGGASPQNYRDGASVIRKFDKMYFDESIPPAQLKDRIYEEWKHYLGIDVGLLHYISAGGSMNQTTANGIRDMLTYFKIPLSINHTGAITEEVFLSVGAKNNWGESVENTYDYGTITIIQDVVDEATIEKIS